MLRGLHLALLENDIEYLRLCRGAESGLEFELGGTEEVALRALARVEHVERIEERDERDGSGESPSAGA